VKESARLGRGLDGWTLAARSVPFAVALVHAAVGISVLYRTQPNDDAFILFAYVKNLVDGQGIVFWPGGPHAEGATDFLWMLLIAGLVRIGFDFAIAAACLNAVGAGLTSWLCGRAVGRVLGGGPAAFVLTLLSGSIVWLGGGLPSHLGFGTSAYTGLCVLLLALWIELPARRIHWILWAGLVASLFRPDGAILLAGFAALGLVRAWRGGALASYSAHAVLTAAAGAGYYFWRFWYFGLALPLPIYVKGHSAQKFSLSNAISEPAAAFPGLAPIRDWCSHSIGPVPLLIGFAVLAVASRRTWSAATLLIGFLPFLAHLAALALAQQSQNFGFRFEAPAWSAAFFGLVLAGAHATAAARAPAWRVAACATAVLAVLPGNSRMIRLFPLLTRDQTYLDTLAPRLRRILPRDRTIASTEPGRIAFWTSVRVIDVVGLNNPHTAIVPADASYVRSLDPDTVVFYCDPGLFGFVESLDRSEDRVVPLDPESFTDLRRTEYQPVLEHGLPDWKPGLLPEHIASLALARFLRESPNYDVYAVGTTRHNHIWALRHDLPETAAILEGLRATAGGEIRESYAQSAELWLAPKR
jgi:hypothetical protein